MKYRRLLLLFLCAFALVSVGCQRGVPSRVVTVPTEAFSAEIEGTLGGVPFAARLEIGAEDGGTRTFSLCFLPTERGAPTDGGKVAQGGLPANLTLSGVCGADGKPVQTVDVRLEDLHVTVDAADVREMLLPVTVLCSARDHRTIQRTEEGYLLQLSNGASMTLDGDGRPLSYSSARLSFSVIS